MSSRRPPSQRNAEYAEQRYGRQLQSMTPGTAGGRLASAAPVRVGSDAIATIAPGVDGASELLFAYDTFALTSAAPTLSLSYVPADGSLHVYLNGLEQHEGTDYTLSGLTLTVLAAMDTGNGDTLDARYAYSSDQAVVVSTVPGFSSVASIGGTTAPAGGTATPAPALTFAAGDLLVLIATCAATGFSAPAGFTLLETSSSTQFEGRVWTKTATDATDNLTVSGLTDQYGVIAYAFGSSSVSQHALGTAVSASNAPVNIATPSLTASSSAYALHIWFLRGDYSAAAITVPGGLSSTASLGGSNNRVAAGLENATTGVATTQTATGTSSAGTVDGRGVQLLVNT